MCTYSIVFQAQLQIVDQFLYSFEVIFVIKMWLVIQNDLIRNPPKRVLVLFVKMQFCNLSLEISRGFL